MVKCPQECQTSHNEHRITMTKIFGKLDNIEEKLDNALEELKTLAECKADKSEVDAIKIQLSEDKKSTTSFKDISLYTILGVLFTLCVFLLQQKFFP